MSTPPVHHIDVRAFRYATEVPDRVDTALRAVYPPLGGDEEPIIDRTVTEGHFGHRIDIYEFQLSTAAAIERFFDRLRDDGVLEPLRAELPERVTDDTELFVRFDKQSAYTEGVLEFGRGIEVRAKIEAYPARKAAAIENLDAYLETLEGGS